MSSAQPADQQQAAAPLPQPTSSETVGYPHTQLHLSIIVNRSGEIPGDF